jgi:MFS family permease
MALNSILGVAAESVSAAAEVMLLPSLVLAFFVAELTPSYATIGLVPAIAIGFWTLGRLPAHLLAQSRRRQQPWAFAAAIVRAAAIGVLAVVASRTDSGDLSESARPLILTVFLCLITFSLAGGFGSVTGGALLQSSVATETWGTFVRRRAAWSTLLSILAAVVVARLLGNSILPFPGSYGRLFLVATVCLVTVAVFTAAMREPSAAAAALSAPNPPPRAWRQPFQDSRYRRFLLFRILLSSTAAIDPFLFLYAITRVGAPITKVGDYVILGVLGWVLAAPVWFWVGRRSGARTLLQTAAVVRLIAPALALAAPPLAAIGLVRERLPDATALTTAYGAVFFVVGAALAAQSRGNYDYLAALAPHPVLPAYTGLTNAILVIVAFSPVLGGILIERFGYEALFGVAAAVGLATVFAGGWLAETPSRVRERQDAGHAATTRAFSSGPA